MCWLIAQIRLSCGGTVMTNVEGSSPLRAVSPPGQPLLHYIRKVAEQWQVSTSTQLPPWFFCFGFPLGIPALTHKMMDCSLEVLAKQTLSSPSYFCSWCSSQQQKAN